MSACVYLCVVTFYESYVSRMFYLGLMAYSKIRKDCMVCSTASVTNIHYVQINS